MATPTFTVIPATEVASIQNLKRSVISGKIETLPEREAVYGLLAVVAEELSRALEDPLFIKNQIQVSMDPVILTGTYFHLLTDYLVSRGFTFTINPSSLTISW